MKTIVVTPNEDKKLNLAIDSANKKAITSCKLDNRRKEDTPLILAIEEGMKSEKLPLGSSYKILDNLLG